MAEINSEAEKIPAKKSKPFRKFLSITLLIAIVAWLIYYFICGFTYSEGSRSGVLTKVSKKGYIVKTYEGELYVGGFNEGSGTGVVAPRIFNFSIYKSNEHIFKQLDSLQGERVILYYKQVFKNFFWQGETDYFIHEVKIVK